MIYEIGNLKDKFQIQDIHKDVLLLDYSHRPQKSIAN
jgi:hypothetical protein